MSSPFDIEDYRCEAIYQYKFKDVTETLSEDEESLDSPQFTVRNLSWFIQIKPYRDEETREIIALSCFLLCADLKPQMSCGVKKTLSLIRNQQLIYSKGEFSDTYMQSNDTCGFFEFISWAQLTDPNGGYLLDDCLTIEVRMKADVPQGVTYQSPKEEIKNTLQPISRSVLGSHLGNLLKSQNGADITFIVQEDAPGTSALSIKAHKLILTHRSPVFAATFSAGMKESSSKKVNIEDIRGSAFKILLHHIYTGELNFSEEIEVTGEICKQVIHAAEKYDFPDLKEYAGIALTEFISVENALEYLMYAKLYKAENAEKAFALYVKNNIDGVLDKLDLKF